MVLEERYFKIASFIIKFTFYPTESSYHQIKFIRSIEKHLKGFLFLKEREVKTDFSIDFLAVRSVKTLVDKDSKLQYINFYRLRANNTLISYYHISFDQLEVILALILQFILEHRGGFFLHASSNKIGNSAYIFTGSSGGGKSTAMMFLKDNYPPLADDKIIILNKEKTYYAYQTHFIEKAWWIKKESEGVELGKVFFIKKADYFNIEKIKDKHWVIHALMKQLLHSNVEHNRRQVKAIMRFVSDYDEFYNLWFRKEKANLINMIK